MSRRIHLLRWPFEGADTEGAMTLEPENASRDEAKRSSRSTIAFRPRRRDNMIGDYPFGWSQFLQQLKRVAETSD